MHHLMSSKTYQVDALVGYMIRGARNFFRSETIAWSPKLLRKMLEYHVNQEILALAFY